jgi:hypothetical protein
VLVISLICEWITCNIEQYVICRDVIGEVRYGFFRIYAPTPYSAVFLLHAPAPIKIGFGAVQCGLVWCGVGAVLRFGLDSFRSN